MKVDGKTTICLMIAVLSCLAVALAYPQKTALKDNITMDSLASRALETFLKVSYKGNGKPITASGINSWLTKNKVSLSKLPKDISAGIQKGTVEGMVIPDVSNPADPGTFGEVVLVRSKCLLTDLDCSHRGLLIQPGDFFGKSAGEECWCENCSGCEGGEPPNCDIYHTCVCTSHPCSKGCTSCKKCAGC